jgi:hypothetical protein
MDQLPVPTAQNINKAHRLARESAESAVQWAIQCGELLIAKKSELAHGNLHAWIEENCAFALSTAKRYMAAASKNATGLAFSSLRHYFPSGQPQPAAVEPVQTATAVAEPLSQVVDPEENQPSEPDEGAAPDVGEEARLNEYYASLERAAESGAQPELKRMAEELATVKSTRDGYMNERTAAVTRVKTLQRTNDRLERENTRLKQQVEKLKAENAELRKAVRAAA